MDDSQKPKKNLSLKEKIAEGWKAFKDQAAFWLEDIISNKKKLVPMLIVTIIGIFAFIRGVIKMLFY
jgi:hypothetical protein